jgi:hypothetical protein
MKKPKPDSVYLERIRQYFQRTGRPPRVYDIDRYTSMILRKRLGGWKSVVRAALGDDVVVGAGTKEQAIRRLKTRCDELGRLPLMDEVEDAGRYEHLFESVDNALMAAVGRNYTSEICAALAALDGSASSYELIGYLRNRLPLTLNNLRGFLNQAKRRGLITGGCGSGRVAVWHLTQKGAALVP